MIQNNDSSEDIQPKQEKQEKYVFFHLVEKVGVMGKYQISLFITICMLSLMVGANHLITPFLFFQDHYVCDSLPSKECLDFVCSLSPPDRLPFTPSPSIHSFANKFGDYRCPD